MKVILLEDVERVGRQGEVLNVRDGYARNFLLPNRKALVASRDQLKRIEQVRARLEARRARAARKLANRAAQIEQLALRAVLNVGSEGKAFGAITNADVAEMLAQAGVEVDKHDVLLENPIKEAGVHDVVIRVGPDARAVLKLWVTGTAPEPAEPS